MEELSIITITYELYKKLAELNAALDKRYRYSLGEPAVSGCADLLQQLILAKHAPKALKATYLIQAEALAERLALQLRAMLELNLANETNLLKLQARLSEARRMLGGWRKSVP